MEKRNYQYIVIGSGLAGGSAVEGIRELDTQGDILLIGNENLAPYDRPPLSKSLWFGNKRLDEIFVHNNDFYRKNNIDTELNSRIVSIDPEFRMIVDSKDKKYSYRKLLLATGGFPRKFAIPGNNLREITYYRYLNDYLKLKYTEAKSAVVIGGGFIGSEMAAALQSNKIQVTMLFPEKYICAKVFPQNLGKSLTYRFEDKGIRILSGDRPISFEKERNKCVTNTENGKKIESDIIIVGVGIFPDLRLSDLARLNSMNGIVVNEYLQTSNPDIYAAGDNTYFYSKYLGKNIRVEHWDNAVTQGKHAGRNMAGAAEKYSYIPYFFSDLFDFSYEAVGDINPGLEVSYDWKKENDTGTVYFLENRVIRGMMMCNTWNQVDRAREIITRNEKINAGSPAGILK